MGITLPAGWREPGTNDVGTLWIMRHGDHRARCALVACQADRWELRVLVDGHVVLSSRCRRGDAAFALADEWEAKMTAVGWRRITPPASPSRSRLPARVLTGQFAT